MGAAAVGLYGVGLIGAALFRADPMDGFPVGTAEGAGAVSWHGGLHMVAAGIGFYVAVVLAWAWVSALAVHLYRHVDAA